MEKEWMDKREAPYEGGLVHVESYNIYNCEYVWFIGGLYGRYNWKVTDLKR